MRHGEIARQRRERECSQCAGPRRTQIDQSHPLEHIECNAACDYAPVVMVNWEFFDNQTPSSARELVTALRDGQAVAPSRGAAALCSFRETARTLAGLGPHVADTTGPGAPTLAGLRASSEDSRRQSASNPLQGSSLNGANDGEDEC